jgi:hypothetical protein
MSVTGAWRMHRDLAAIGGEETEELPSPGFSERILMSRCAIYGGSASPGHRRAQPAGQGSPRTYPEGRDSEPREVLNLVSEHGAASRIQKLKIAPGPIEIGHGYARRRRARPARGKFGAAPGPLDGRGKSCISQLQPQWTPRRLELGIASTTTINHVAR